MFLDLQPEQDSDLEPSLTSPAPLVFFITFNQRVCWASKHLVMVAAERLLNSQSDAEPEEAAVGRLSLSVLLFCVSSAAYLNLFFLLFLLLLSHMQAASELQPCSVFASWSIIYPR